MIKAYLVGGYVRDQLLGVKSKDRDYTVVAPSYSAMVEWIKERGKIFMEKPEYLTVRAQVGKQAADFVLARKDGSYSDGRRPDVVEPGTIYDDLARRDFTMNAIAFDEETGEYIDPHGGREDLKAKKIKCVGDAYTRFNEDALRILRALRFSITKDMSIDGRIHESLVNESLLVKLKISVSVDRKRDELQKAFAHDTPKTLRCLWWWRGVADACFEDTNLWLMPTSKERT